MRKLFLDLGCYKTSSYKKFTFIEERNKRWHCEPLTPHCSWITVGCMTNIHMDIGPYFYRNRGCETVNVDQTSYRAPDVWNFWLLSRERGSILRTNGFSKSFTSPHHTFQMLRQQTDNTWQPNSPDLKSIDYLFRGHIIKNQPCSNSTTALGMKVEIKREVTCLTLEKILPTIENQIGIWTPPFRNRIHMWYFHCWFHGLFLFNV